MVNKYVKQWEYECSVTFEVTDKSVEKLALMKNPPDNANCIVDPKDLRFIKSTVKEVKQVANNVSKTDKRDTGDRKREKKSFVENKQSEKQAG
jgi:hypothetical protein